jgi:hypothetical protein
MVVLSNQGDSKSNKDMNISMIQRNVDYPLDLFRSAYTKNANEPSKFMSA